MSSSQNRQIRVDIVVQPPSMVGVNRRLIPPVVARTSDPEIVQIVMGDSTRIIYATMMLTATSGDDYTTAFNGNYNVNGNLVENSGSGGGSSSRSSRSHYVYFIFNPVSITMTGTFTITVAVSMMDTAAGMSYVVGGRTTRQITVVNDPVPPERPSSSERHILRQLEAAGFYRP